MNLKNGWDVHHLKYTSYDRCKVPTNLSQANWKCFQIHPWPWSKMISSECLLTSEFYENFVDLKRCRLKFI